MNNALQTTIPETELSDPDSVVEAIVGTVADAEGKSPLEIQPLATVTDPDALCALVRHGNCETTIEFSYCGYRVRVVSGDRTVHVELSTDD
ncbi:HalOD1 output domain-containing protein [Halopiger goleimassiliensis]|uniref:HalOD1 output domain-containing protein n=1 Tax=Halopiger goleimassiliensis TaxID=1293048 RepID=UPI00067827A1|nr:HalOD1 output domain-containing protein [Halopiger goleimassiliensis]